MQKRKLRYLLADILFSSHLEDDEHILFIARRYCDFFLDWRLWGKMILGLVVPAALYFAMPTLWYVWLIWELYGIFVLLYALMDWYFDAWLITTLGILTVKWDGFFHREASRIEYHTIDEVGYSIKGFLNTMLSIGDVVMKKTGGDILSLLKAANPKRIQREIVRYQTEFLQAKSFKDHEALKDMLSDMILYHQKLKKE